MYVLTKTVKWYRRLLLIFFVPVVLFVTIQNLWPFLERSLEFYLFLTSWRKQIYEQKLLW